MPNPNYMAGQKELAWQMRGILTDWLIQVHLKFRLLPETLFLCINIIDRFLSIRVVSLAKLQLVGVACMFIAAKFEEVVAPSVTHFLHCADSSYTEAEILNAEIGATKSWNGQYSVDCEKVKDLPPLTFYIDGKPFTREGKDYVLEVQGSCISSFSGLNLPGPLANMLIVGDVFLRKYYSVYDLGKNAVGLATAK